MTSTAAANSWPVMASWRVVFLLMGFAALGHFNRVGIAVAGSEVFIPKLGLSESRMGWVYTTFLIVYTLGMLPGGWLIDRIGAVRALALYGVTMGTFVGLTGTLGWITTTSASLWIGLLVIRGLGGACNAPLHPGAAHVVSDLMTDHRRATANGFITAGALIGIACCFRVFGWLMDRLDWPLAFVVSGLTLAGYGWLWKLIALKTMPAVVAAPVVEANVAVPWPLLRQFNLWWIALSYAAYGYFQYLFFYWMDY